MRDNNSPAPIFDTDEDRTYFLVEFPINKEFLVYTRNQDKDQDNKANIDMLNDMELKIFNMIKEETLSK